jgi:5-hydroxyisourate hydrolase
MGKLTTHVLDTAHGRPGEGIAIALYRCTPHGRLLLGHHVTNADGRCDAPLLVGSAFTIGTYELEFWVGDYYQRLGVELMQPRFLDVVTLRFGIADEAGHYHVPLLVSPFGYTTYRGS